MGKDVLKIFIERALVTDNYNIQNLIIAADIYYLKRYSPIDGLLMGIVISICKELEIKSINK